LELPVMELSGLFGFEQDYFNVVIRLSACSVSTY